MKNHVDIIVQRDDVEYNLRLEHKISVITGSSATGKTTLMRLINDYINNKVGKIKAEGLSIINLETFNLMGSEIRERNYIVLIDENNSMLRNSKFIHRVNRSAGFFVFITRLSNIPSLNIDVRAIYTLDSNIVNGKTYITLSRRFDKYIGVGKSHKDLVSEDSGAGCQLGLHYGFREVGKFSNSNITSNNSNVVRRILNSGLSNVTVFIDLVAFGFYINDLIQLQESINIFIVDSQSFEYLLLHHTMFTKRDLLITPNISYDFSKYRSLENLYEELYKDFCLTKFDYKYNKSKLESFMIDEGVDKEVRKRFKLHKSVTKLSELNKE